MSYQFTCGTRAFKSHFSCLIVRMEVEIKDNILYGGDPEVNGPIDGNCVSFGQFIIKELRTGGNKTTFVRRALCKIIAVYK